MFAMMNEPCLIKIPHFTINDLANPDTFFNAKDNYDYKGYNLVMSLHESITGAAPNNGANLNGINQTVWGGLNRVREVLVAMDCLKFVRKELFTENMVGVYINSLNNNLVFSHWTVGDEDINRVFE